MKNNKSNIYGHTPQKQFGQNFLQDESIINDIVNQIKIYSNPNDYIIEIGPGLCALTDKLVMVFDNLQVIEIDKNLAYKISLKYPKLKLFNQDALKFDFNIFASSLNQKIHIVGNLPYNISSPLLLHLLTHINNIKSQHFMLQREVVDRMVATHKTKAYGRLSILLQAHYTMEKTIDVPPQAFFPPPKVDSAVVLMQPNIQVNLKEAKILEYLTRICFSQRRKMLRSFVEHKAIFEEYGIDLTKRAEEISVQEYLNLAKWWNESYPML